MAVAPADLTPDIPPIGRLMLVDDAPFDHAALRRAAARSGLVGEIEGFFMAEDALEYLARRDRPPVDAMLVDIHMPRMDGLEFLAATRDRFGPGVAGSIHMAMTLAPDADLLAGFEALGIVDGWVEKPFDAAALGKVATALASGRAH